MTIEYTAFAIGAFFIAVVLIWKKLRFIDARLREMRTELNELRTVETRLFMMALNASPKLTARAVEPQKEAAQMSPGEVVSKDHEHTPPPGQEHEFGAGRKPAWPLQKSDP
jgi:hypothetical protein